MSSESTRKDEEDNTRKNEEDTSVSMDAVLSDDLLERVLSLLPISSIRNATLVSKRWHAVVHRPWAVIPPPQTALFFMFIDTNRRPVEGRTYNPILRRWSTAHFPFIEKDWHVVASSGLVCVMAGRDTSRRLFVCNPLTGDFKQLPHGPPLSSAIPRTIAMSVDRQTHSYTIAVVSRCKRAVDDDWDVSVLVYESKSQTWAIALTQPMPWSGDSCVICNGVLYCFPASNTLNPTFRLLAYDLMARPRSKAFVPIAVPPQPSRLKSFILVVKPMLSNLWLINLRERVVIVALIQNKHRPSKMVALGIWELEEEGWREVVRLKADLIREKFGDQYHLIYSCGAGDFVYVHRRNSEFVLTFDMETKYWEWSKQCPIEPTDLSNPSLTGFCLEPNFKINC